jgi:DNA (cytosine-5)-methyltransferase 1
VNEPAYYNEIDPIAAQWLRNLIAAGHIAPGDVDERSIEDVRPDDLAGYRQCHFFAGIGVWSYALRRAGWPDDREIWTGSCPCQPFSAAGSGNGFEDQRHLWPAFFHLIRERRPAAVAGEQVASKDAEPWIDLVCADLGSLGYASGAVAFPSASVGAPHIRDRLYWMAHADSQRFREARPGELSRERAERAQRGGDPGRLADAEREHRGCEAEPSDHRQQEANGPADRAGGRSGASGELADAEKRGRREERADPGKVAVGDRAEGLAARLVHGVRAGGLGNTECDGLRSGRRPAADLPDESGDRTLHAGALAIPGPTNGFWRAADWLLCRDGQWRPVEPGTFPLAHGAPGRVGRLRAYGNAINAEAARVFCEAMIEVI